MGTTVKGVLKGFRYITQIFDEEKEPEMEIGFPTDVKHVGHIGWDGPIADSPSWMDNFKNDRESMSGPLRADESSFTSDTYGASPGRDFPDIPRLSMDSSIEKSEKTSSKHSRKSKSASGSRELSNRTSNGSSSARNQLLPDSIIGCLSPGHKLPDVPKSSRRKKSKDSSQGGSSKSSSRTAKAIAEASHLNFYTV